MAEGYNFKIVLLGEGCVGKTSCVLRYVEDKFNDKHITTLQVFFKRTAFIFFFVKLKCYKLLLQRFWNDFENLLLHEIFIISR